MWPFILGCLFTLLIWYLYKSAVIVPARKMALVERMGLYQQTLLPGLYFLWYPFEYLRWVHWTYRNQQNQLRHVNECYVSNDLQQMDVPPIRCVSKETTPITVDIVVMYVVTNLHTAVYETGDVLNLFYQAVHQAVRDVCSEYEVEKLQGRNNTISEDIVTRTMQSFGDKRGIKCHSVLVQDVSLGQEALNARKERFQQEQIRKRKMDELQYQEEVQKREQEMLRTKLEFEAAQEKRAREQHLRPYLDNGFTPADIVAMKQAEALANAKELRVIMSTKEPKILISEK